MGKMLRPRRCQAALLEPSARFASEIAGSTRPGQTNKVWIVATDSIAATFTTVPGTRFWRRRTGALQAAIVPLVDEIAQIRIAGSGRTGLAVGGSTRFSVHYPVPQVLPSG